MSDIVTGSTPQTIISDRGNGYGYGNGYGGFNDPQRDLYPFLIMQRMEAGHADLVRDVHRENSAVHLAVEKTAAASAVQVEKIAAAAALAAAQNTAAVQAAIAECCCEVKALALSIESNRVRDELAQLRLELATAKSGGNGNA